MRTTWRLRGGVYSVVRDGRLHVMVASRTAALGPATEEHRAALRTLATDPQPADALPAGLFESLRSGGWLDETVSAGGRPLWTAQPIRRPDRPGGTRPATPRLCPYAVIRATGDGFVVESPRAWGQLAVHDPAVLAALGGAPDALHAEQTARLWADAWRFQLVADDGDDFRLRQWRPHELWFHERSRISDRSFFGAGYGRTNWARDLVPPLPARPPGHPGPTVELRRPDLDRLRETDMPLARAVEQRRSRRDHDDARPITADQLGELLYRCARVRAETTHDGQEYPSKPYPSGGSAYELEVYPVVRHAAGLAAGLYHYEAYDHRLRRIRPLDHPARRLLRTAEHASGAPAPQVLLVISARFGRLMWRYEEMAYALVLKHVGVLMQSLYLAATAMDLAACALGGGDATAFTAATDTDPLVEGSVGEFMVGSRVGD